MSSKIVINQTPHNIAITFYIRGKQAETNDFGTRVIYLQAGQTTDLEFGDYEHGFLNGVSIEAVIDGTRVIQKQMIESWGNRFDNDLNFRHILEVKNIDPLKLDHIA